MSPTLSAWLALARDLGREFAPRSAAHGADDSGTAEKVDGGYRITARAAIAAVEKAMEVVGGASFYRSTGLERL